MSGEEKLDDAFMERERRRVWDEAHEHYGHRALIEQTKGMLMFVYGIDADEAFDVLRSQSQQHNIKLRVIAEQILKDLVELAQARGPARRLAFDGLMLTAHKRITDVAARQLDGQRKTGVPMKDLKPWSQRNQV
jgi:hypothetical protein